ncbi:hypothetical protein [Bosea sp. NBC_00550]|uniref:hypothetical protein n=1 Tax=Bosea sp. NBC_00550 TaxID=2969621 RepID=UPI0022302045|nr:hypothetical protein NWE53_12335 [Bosea sp. NBC_00550]
MGDVEDRQAELVAQPAERVDDRHAQRGIDHRDRLVGDNQAGLGDEATAVAATETFLKAMESFTKAIIMAELAEV